MSYFVFGNTIAFLNFSSARRTTRGVHVLLPHWAAETPRGVSSRIPREPELACRLRVGASSKRDRQDRRRRRRLIFLVQRGNRLDPSCRESIATPDAPGLAGQKGSVHSAH